MCVSMTALSRRGFTSRDFARFSGKQSRYSNRSKTSMNSNLSRWCPTLSCIVGVSQVSSHSYESCRMFSSAKIPLTSDTIVEALTKQQAKDWVSKLTSEERKLFLTALNENKSQEEKAGYEGKRITHLYIAFNRFIFLHEHLAVIFAQNQFILNENLLFKKCILIT